MNVQANSSEVAQRRWFRRAAGWLLLNAGAHLTAHVHFYADPETFAPARRQLYEALAGHLVSERTGVSAWTVLTALSLGYALLLILWGSGQWVLARECELQALRRHALRQSLLCAVAALALVLWYPLPQALILFTGAAVLYALAYRRSR